MAEDYIITSRTYRFMRNLQFGRFAICLEWSGSVAFKSFKSHNRMRLPSLNVKAYTNNSLHFERLLEEVCRIEKNFKNILIKISLSLNMEAILEDKRIENLYKYEILDTPADGYFDEITSLAAKIFNVPIAIITLVDTQRIWFKSSHGLDAEEIPRSPGLCSSAIMSPDIYIVEDARNDPRTLSNPLVAGIMGLQFYAAAPLGSADGYNLGTICLIDKEPRSLDAQEASMLRQLSRIVVAQFELKLQARLMVKEIHKNIAGNLL